MNAPRVPSRQLSRYVSGWLLQVAVVQGADGAPQLDPGLESVLEEEGRTLRTDEVMAAFPGFGPFVDAAVPVAQAGAEARKTELMRSARAAINAERDAALTRMKLALAHQGLAQAKVTAQLDAERAHYDALAATLDGLKLALDSACGFVINR